MTWNITAIMEWRGASDDEGFRKLWYGVKIAFDLGDYTTAADTYEIELFKDVEHPIVSVAANRRRFLQFQFVRIFAKGMLDNAQEWLSLTSGIPFTQVPAAEYNEEYLNELLRERS